MSKKPLVEYEYTLIPNGETQASASEVRTETVTAEYDTSCTTKTGVYKLLSKENIIDQYALKNHWNISNISCQYANPPWQSWSEFEEHISNIDETVYVETHTFDGQFTVIISVQDGKETAVGAEIKDYFALLNPIIKSGQVTVCPEAPLIEIEESI